MSKFSNTLQKVIQHWPMKVDETDPMVRAIATMAAGAGSTDQEIEEFCLMLSDLSDRAFQRGIDAANSLPL